MFVEERGNLRAGKVVYYDPQLAPLSWGFAVPRTVPDSAAPPACWCTSQRGYGDLDDQGQMIRIVSAGTVGTDAWNMAVRRRAGTLRRTVVGSR
ncbi:hypothetical protein IPZ61_02260 [Streptomyces sioyaensis]|uniref:hypothetical protein n=1 Tax=Streptomyces sioyaensis TaxID=67364 RepID=UPI001F36856F|nr:hypothetical protein [Streptomyces sioyaensis]MCF3172164.1 hypothetical protein [Streptomyces sioyaensis]